MLRPLSLITALLIPATALALDFSPSTFYRDVRQNSPEAPGINMLTREHIVQGYMDGRFGHSRLINRAEFLKMALMAVPPSKRLTDTIRGLSCFSDVPADAWFAEHVCTAQAASVVAGNPDGLFHPERTVQYDEALKILAILFQYKISGSVIHDWAQPYYESAVSRGTDLPVTIRFDSPLTRGMAARLIAGFLAEHEGRLTDLRYAESGRYDLISSSASSSSSVSSSTSQTSSSVSSVASSSSMSSSLSSSSSSSVKPLFTFPPVSRFLLVGELSDAIADITIPSDTEHAYVSAVTVKLFNEVRSVENLQLTTEDGTVVATMLRRTTTDTPDYKQTFEVQISPERQYELHRTNIQKLALRAKIRSIDNAGFSDELLQVRSISVTLRGATSLASSNIPSTGPFPKHQTSFGRISSVSRTSPEAATLSAGNDVLVTSVALRSSGLAQRPLSPTQITFAVQKTGTMTVTDWTLRRRGQSGSAQCTFNIELSTVNCTFLRDAIGSLPTDGVLDLDLTADITIPANATNNSLQASLSTAGSPESFGSIEWTDGSGTFRWIEAPSPILSGTLLR